MKYQKTIGVLEIIASELHMPKDASLSEILATISLIDVDGEIMQLLAETGAKELCEAIKGEQK